MTENDVEWIHAGLGLAGITTPVDAERLWAAQGSGADIGREAIRAPIGRLGTLGGGEICLMGGLGPALAREAAAS
jgi:hypothetical protein